MRNSDVEFINEHPYHYDLAFRWSLHSKYKYLLNYEVSPECRQDTFYFESVALSEEIESLDPADRECFDKCLRIIKARKQKQFRLRKLYQSWKNQGYMIHFVTFTFNADFITLKDAVKRKYVTRFLADKCIDYWGNVDYGSINNRIHYHLCCVFRNSNEFTTSILDKNGIQHYNNDWAYGFNDIQVSNSDNTEYMDKIVNHAIKESTESGSNIIRPRKKRKKS